MLSQDLPELCSSLYRRPESRADCRNKQSLLVQLKGEKSHIEATTTSSLDHYLELTKQGALGTE